MYRKSLGLPPLEEEKKSSLPIIVGAFAGVVVVLVVAMLIAFVVFRRKAAEFGKQWVIKESDVVFGDKIGSGGFGTVFKGKWQGNVVAIKQVPLGGNQEPVSVKDSAFTTKNSNTKFTKDDIPSERRKLWEKELRVICKLRHTNVSYWLM